MRICILSDAYENSSAPTKEYDIQCDPTPYLTEHDCETVYLQKATAVRQIIELSRRGFDVFINLCDGAWDEDRPGIEVVQALERLGLAFTGAGSACYDPTRESMKRVCAAWGLHTPAHVFVENEGEATWRAASLRYPMIVKHPGSYNSIGLTPASRVMSAEALGEQTALMINTYGGALIEEFIEGREFTVLVAENPDDPQLPMAYTPVEFQFPAGESFKHFDLKWVHYDRMSAIPCTDPVLTERLKQVSREFFLGLGGSGYGRCDIRMDEHGDLYLLEINPNCDVFYPLDSPGSADFILMNDPAGHIGFTRQIIRAAFARQARQRRNWEVQSSSKSNYGMIARRFIPAGQLIEAYEEQPHVLVSKSYVEEHWDALQRGWFEQYAYPITEEIYVMWASEPEAWKPINHACNPNAWLDGLNLVARRDIVAGEEITMDYATFCGELMQPFICSCGSADCRGIIRGTDFLLPFVERYGNHISDYVRTKRRLLANYVPQPG